MLPQTPASISRRDLLKAGGAIVVSFAFAVAPRRSEGRSEDQGAAQTPASSDNTARPLDPGEVDGLLAIHADGSVTLYTSKVDVGTGLRIALAQMAAEELGVAPTRVSVVEGDTSLCPDQGGTGGSTGLTRGGTEIRAAAATARRALLELGAAQLNRPAAGLTIIDGEVRPLTGGAGVGIGTLIGDRRFALKVDAKAPLTPAARHTSIGKPLPRPDVPDKCTGRHVYVQDFTLPGMLHGRIIRPPAIGATLVSVDESSIRGIPDTRVVRIESFLAVVAKDEWAAVRAAAALKATWTNWEELPGHQGLDRYSRTAALERDQSIVNRGDAPAAMRGAAKRLSATYFWPFQSHASLGPSCACCRCSRRRKHDRLVRVAGNPRSSNQPGESVRPAAREDARHFSRWLWILWHERRRPRRGRRAPPVEDRRPAHSRAVDAPR
jgi:CO/xanthine dehydrogenase Mo-binding subunit